jgi:hypothetical protein
LFVNGLVAKQQTKMKTFFFFLTLLFVLKGGTPLTTIYREEGKDSFVRIHFNVSAEQKTLADTLGGMSVRFSSDDRVEEVHVNGIDAPFEWDDTDNNHDAYYGRDHVSVPSSALKAGANLIAFVWYQGDDSSDGYLDVEAVVNNDILPFSALGWRAQTNDPEDRDKNKLEWRQSTSDTVFSAPRGTDYRPPIGSLNQDIDSGDIFPVMMLCSCKKSCCSKKVIIARVDHFESFLCSKSV